MTKKEIIWRDILVQFRLKKRVTFTQKELAAYFGFSLSTVFNALKTLREAHVVEVSGRNFRLDSYKKLLLLWASMRRIDRDIIYRARVELDTKSLEALMPPHVRFGFYSAFSFAYNFTPADYDHVYVYSAAVRVSEILNRLPASRSKNRTPNFFILKEDPWFARYHDPFLEQILVDVWNAPEWYAKDFLKSLEEKLPISYV